MNELQDEMELKTVGDLLFGLVSIYQKKVTYTENDCKNIQSKFLSLSQDETIDTSKTFDNLSVVQGINDISLNDYLSEFNTSNFEHYVSGDNWLDITTTNNKIGNNWINMANVSNVDNSFNDSVEISRSASVDDSIEVGRSVIVNDKVIEESNRDSNIRNNNDNIDNQESPFEGPLIDDAPDIEFDLDKEEKDNRISIDEIRRSIDSVNKRKDEDDQSENESSNKRGSVFLINPKKKRKIQLDDETELSDTIIRSYKRPTQIISFLYYKISIINIFINQVLHQQEKHLELK